MDPRGRSAVTRGLVSLAVSQAASGAGEDEARLLFIQVLRAHGTADPALVAEAADAVRDLPDPAEDEDDTVLDTSALEAAPSDTGSLEAGALDAVPGRAAADAVEDAEDAPAGDERERVRRALGLVSPSEELTARLIAREWLQKFAADLAR